MTVPARTYIIIVLIYLIHLIQIIHLPREEGKKGMIILDYRDTRPLYEQIVDKFQTLILSGALEPNSRMPSVRSLAVELAINPNTIQRAYSELERQGFLYTVKGRGNFVAYNSGLLDVRRREIFERLDNLKREALAVGLTAQELAGRLLQGGKDD